MKVDLDHTRTWVRDVVRSGLWSEQVTVEEIRAVIASDHPDLDPDRTAHEWIAAERAAWADEATTWESPTDHDLLQRAFAAASAAGFVVLQGCADHWAAKEVLAHTDPVPRGVLWFTPADIWHAIDEAMLEVNLWHPSTANAAPGEPLLDEVLAFFATAGLPAHFDEGRVEVAARWRRWPR